MKFRYEEPDAKGATEDQIERISVIVGDEVLGYSGYGREEHSGENAPQDCATLEDDLAEILELLEV